MRVSPPAASYSSSRQGKETASRPTGRSRKSSRQAHCASGQACASIPTVTTPPARTSLSRCTTVFRVQLQHPNTAAQRNFFTVQHATREGYSIAIDPFSVLQIALHHATQAAVLHRVARCKPQFSPAFLRHWQFPARGASRCNTTRRQVALHHLGSRCTCCKTGCMKKFARGAFSLLQSQTAPCKRGSTATNTNTRNQANDQHHPPDRRPEVRRPLL